MDKVKSLILFCEAPGKVLKKAQQYSMALINLEIKVYL